MSWWLGLVLAVRGMRGAWWHAALCGLVVSVVGHAVSLSWLSPVLTTFLNRDGWGLFGVIVRPDGYALGGADSAVGLAGLARNHAALIRAVPKRAGW